MSADHETAERLTRSRARVIPGLVVVFALMQAAYFTAGGADIVAKGPDILRLYAWLIMSFVLLLFLATGGGFFRAAKVRTLLNDETTKAHRAKATAAGFWVAMILCFIMYGATMYEQIAARTAVHVILTAGIGTALLRFAILERRALI